MATFTVTSALDDNGAGLTLREAIAAAEANGVGADDIVFDEALMGQTIRLTSGSLLISSGIVNINGDVDSNGVIDVIISGDKTGNGRTADDVGTMLLIFGTAVAELESLHFADGYYVGPDAASPSVNGTDANVGIMILGSASGYLSNSIISNMYARGGDGGDGLSGPSPGNGGIGGNAFAGIRNLGYLAVNDTAFVGNTAYSGNGGRGGDTGVGTGGTGGAGGRAVGGIGNTNAELVIVGTAFLNATVVSGSGGDGGSSYSGTGGQGGNSGSAVLGIGNFGANATVDGDGAYAGGLLSQGQPGAGGLGINGPDGNAGTYGAAGQTILNAFGNIMDFTDRGQIPTVGSVTGTSTTGNDTLIGANSHLWGLQGHDSITATGAGSNNLRGGGGNDTLEGGAGADTLDGGSNATNGAFGDMVSYSGTNLAVIVNLQTMTATGGHATGDTITRFESATGSAHGDTLTGNGDYNVLRGLAGADTLNGGDGDDVLVGGAGADVLNGDTGVDTVAYSDINNAVSVFLKSNYTNEGGGVFDTLSSIENVTGSNFDDTIEGDSVANFLFGNGGIDTAYYISSVAGVTVNLVSGLGAGGDAAGDSYFSIENVIGSNTGGDTLTGGDEANFFNGNGGADTLDGQGGGDSLFGGDGDDILRPGAGFDYVVGGNNTDTADYSTSVVGVGVHLFFGGGFGGDATGDGITGVENIIGSATAGDTIYGDNGNNILEGLGGDDIIHGSAGADDLYGGAGAGDTAYFFLSAGAITVNLSGGLGIGGDAAGDLFFDIENVIGTQFGGDTLTGNDDTNFINGYGGADIINGGLGSDSLFGGVDNDTFLFTDVAFGFDFIGDWQDGFDTISIASNVAVDMTTVFLTQINASRWFVGIGAAGITVDSASAFTLDPGDFMFV